MSDFEIETITDDDEAPLFKPKKASSNLTLLDQLRRKMEEDITRPDVLISVPVREGVYLVCSPNITREQHKEAAKAATNKKSGDTDSVKLAARLVAEQTRGVQMNGEEVYDDDGLPLTFASQAIRDMTDTLVPVPDAVVAFFGGAHYVEAAALALMEASGLGEEVEVVDPTKTS